MIGVQMNWRIGLRIVVLSTIAMIYGCSGVEHSPAKPKIAIHIAEEIARREIVRRGLSAPRGLQIQVRDSYINYEFVRPRPIFAVTVFLARKGKRKWLYKMNIDKETGGVSDFLDAQTVEPLRL